jgi:hypothetical protein
VKVYPNPATSKIFIEGNATEDSDVIVSTILGQTLLSGKTDAEGRLTIDINGFKPGVYLVTIKKGDRQVVKKIVVN